MILDFRSSKHVLPWDVSCHHLTAPPCPRIQIIRNLSFIPRQFPPASIQSCQRVMQINSISRHPVKSSAACGDYVVIASMFAGTVNRGELIWISRFFKFFFHKQGTLLKICLYQSHDTYFGYVSTKNEKNVMYLMYLFNTKFISTHPRGGVDMNIYFLYCLTLKNSEVFFHSGVLKKTKKHIQKDTNNKRLKLCLQ